MFTSTMRATTNGDTSCISELELEHSDDVRKIVYSPRMGLWYVLQENDGILTIYSQDGNTIVSVTNGCELNIIKNFEVFNNESRVAIHDVTGIVKIFSCRTVTTISQSDQFTHTHQIEIILKHIQTHENIMSIHGTAVDTNTDSICLILNN
jgi:WD40 repeat protein